MKQLTELEKEMLTELKIIADGWQIRDERTRGTDPLNGWEKERYYFVKELIQKAEAPNETKKQPPTKAGDRPHQQQ